jgi:transposase InsO family protein
MPFKWIHAHPDNDSSFINWHLLRYCEAEGIEFSRSRPYKKNDNNFVEQKNSTNIRGVIGHLGYDTEKASYNVVKYPGMGVSPSSM